MSKVVHSKLPVSVAAQGNSTATTPVDIPFLSNYNSNGSLKYSGIFRDQNTGIYRIFNGLSAPPTTSGVPVNDSTFTLAPLEIGQAIFSGTSTSNAITLTNTTGNYNLIWPTSQGLNSTILTNDGSGNLAWRFAVTSDQSVDKADSPTFAGLLLTNFNGVVKAVSGTLSASTLVNSDIDPAAAIQDSKLATISTAGKVSNTATTATALNTPLTIVSRDTNGSTTLAAIALEAENSSNAISISNTNGNYSLVLPTAQGTASTILFNDGSGNLSWVARNQFNQTLNTTDSPTFAALSVTTGTVSTLSSTTGTFNTSVSSPNVIIGVNDAVTLKSSSSTSGSAYTLTMPASQGSNSTTLVNDGSGNLSWTVQNSFNQALNTTNSVTFAQLTTANVVLSGTDPVTLKASSSTTGSAYTVTMPSAQGTANSFLVNDGTGVLSWVARANQSVNTTSNVQFADIQATTAEIATLTATSGAITTGTISTLSGTSGSFTTSVSAPQVIVQGTDTVTLKASSGTGAPYTLTLPPAQGGTATTLLNDGSGNTSWVSRNPFNQSLNTGDSVTHANLTVTTAGTIPALTSTTGTFSTSVSTPQVMVQGGTAVTVKASSSTSGTAYTVTMPAAQGSTSTTLLNDGSGTLTWVSQNPFNQTLNTTSNVTFASAAITTGTVTTLTSTTSTIATLSGTSGSFTTSVSAPQVVVQGTDTVTLKASSSTGAPYTLTLPPAQGGTATTLLNDGSGNTSWVSRNPFNQSLNTGDSVTHANLTVTTAGTIPALTSTTGTFSTSVSAPQVVVQGTDSVTIKASANTQGAAYTLTMPATQGGTSTTLLNDGSGNLSWVAQNPFNQTLNTTSNVQFNGVTASSGTFTTATVGALSGTSATFSSTMSAASVLLSGTDAVTLKASNSTSGAAYTITMPAAQGSAATILLNDGSGNLSWVAQNPFNQTLNTTSNVTFASATITTGTVSTLSGTSGSFTTSVSAPQVVVQGTDAVTLKASSGAGAAYTLTLPPAQGGTATTLLNDGSGNTSWVSRNPFNQSLNTGDSVTHANLTVTTAGTIPALTSTTGTFSTSVSAPQVVVQGTDSVTLKASASTQGSAYSITMPAAQGSASTTLVNDGSGNLSWIAQNPFNQTLNTGSSVTFSNLSTTTAGTIPSLTSTTVTAATSVSTPNVIVSGVDSVTFKASANTQGTAYTLTMPAMQGVASTILLNDGSGNLTWVSQNPFNQLLNTSSSVTFANLTTTTAGTIPALTSTTGTFSTSVSAPSHVVQGGTAVTLKANANTGTAYNLLLPGAQGGASTVLINDGSGNLSWVAQNPFNQALNTTSSVTFANLNTTTAGTIPVLTSTTVTASTSISTPNVIISGTDAVTLKASSSTSGAAYTVTMPAAQGSASTTLVNDGSGNLSWVAQNPFNQTLNTTSNVTFASGTIPTLNSTTGTFSTSVNAPSVVVQGSTAVTLKANATAGTAYNVVLPGAQGGASTTLLNDGNGNLTWVAQNPFNQSLNTSSSVTFANLSTTTAGTIPTLSSTTVTATTSVSTPQVVVQGTDTVTIKASANTQGSAYTVTMPAAQGSASTVMVNDGSGNLSWISQNPFNQLLNTTSSVTFANLTTTTAGTIPTLTSTTGTFSTSVSAPSHVVQGGTAVTLKANATTGTAYNMVLPGAQGGASTVLINDGSGNLSWVSQNPFNQILNTTSSVQFASVSTPSYVISGTDPVTLKASSSTNGSAYTLTMPAAQATGTSLLVNDGTGVLSWAAKSNQTVNTGDSVTFANITVSTAGTIPTLTTTTATISALSGTSATFSSSVSALSYVISGTDPVTLKSSSSTSGSAYTLTMPASQATSTSLLVNDGTGVLSWAAKSNQTVNTGDSVTFANLTTTTAGTIPTLTSTTGTFSTSVSAPNHVISGTDPVTLKANSSTSGSAYTMTMPASQGGINTLLVNDGSGNLSWVSQNPFNQSLNTTNGVTFTTINANTITTAGPTAFLATLTAYALDDNVAAPQVVDSQFATFYKFTQLYTAPGQGTGDRLQITMTTVRSIQSIRVYWNTTTGTPSYAALMVNRANTTPIQTWALNAGIASGTTNVVYQDLVLSTAYQCQSYVLAFSSASSNPVQIHEVQTTVYQAGTMQTYYNIEDDGSGNNSAVTYTATISYTSTVATGVTATDPDSLATTSGNTVSNVVDSNTTTQWQPTALNSSGNERVLLSWSTTGYVGAVHVYWGTTNIPVTVSMYSSTSATSPIQTWVLSNVTPSNGVVDQLLVLNNAVQLTSYVMQFTPDVRASTTPCYINEIQTIFYTNPVGGNMTAMYGIFNNSVTAQNVVVNGVNTVTLQGSTANGSSYTMVLPPSQGSSGTVLTNNGSGVLSWAVTANPFNQTLNTGSSVQFASVTAATGTFTTSVSSPSHIMTGGTGVTLKPSSTTGTAYNLTMPPGQGSATTTLLNDGSGNLSWVARNPFNQSLNTTDSVTHANLTVTTSGTIPTLTSTTATITTATIPTLTSTTGTFSTSMSTPSVVISGTDPVTLRASASTSGSSYTVVMPASQGMASTVMVNDGSGNLSWTAQNPFNQSLNTTSSVTHANLTVTTAGTIPTLTSTSATVATLSGTSATFSGTMSAPSVVISGTDPVTLRASASTSGAAYTMVMPASQGTASTVLVNDGSGNLSWVAQNPFNQTLNTTSSVTFANLTTTTAGTIPTLTSTSATITSATVGTLSGTSATFSGTMSAPSVVVSGTDPVTIKASTASGTAYTVVLPPAQGGATTTLLNDGSGNLSWVAQNPFNQTLNTTSSVTFANLTTTTAGTIPTLNSTTGTFSTSVSAPSVVVSGTDTVTLKASTASGAAYTLTLPPAQGAATTVPLNDGTGVLSWVARNMFNQTVNTTDSPTFANLTLTTAGTVPTLNSTTGTFSTSVSAPSVIVSGTDAVTLKASTASGAAYTLTLPPAQGAATTVPLNDGSGNLSWVARNMFNQTVNTTDSPTFANLTLTGTATVAGNLTTTGNLAAEGNIQITTSTGAYAITLDYANTATSSYTLELPTAQATASQSSTWANDGAGNLSWVPLIQCGSFTYTTASGANESKYITTARTWTTIPINTVGNPNTSAITLNTSTYAMTIPIGKYKVVGFANFYQTGLSQIRLYNSTGSALLVPGASITAITGSANTEVSNILGTFTLTAASTVYLQAYVATVATTPAGVYVGSGEVEVWAGLEITRIG